MILSSVSALADSPEIKYIPADYKNEYLQGYLAERISINLNKRLLAINLETILEPYVSRPGKQEWVGEHIGKFLDAAALTYAFTNHEVLKNKMDKAVEILISTQEPDGYLGTYLEENRWTSWDVWSHKYNMVGLLSYYEVTNRPEALEACTKMADLLVTVFGTEEGQRDIISSGTHIGMAPTSILEPMVNLYKITQEEKYLEFCVYLVESWEQENGPKIISALLESGDVYKTANNKAYEMLSCLVGLADLYLVTGNEKYLKVCEVAWKDIAFNKNYIIGSSSFGEHFTPNNELSPDGEYWNNKYVGPGEGCVTVTWMQFCKRMLEISGNPEIINEVEKTIYNALLASQNPQNGEVCYFLPLQGGRKRFGEITHGLLPDICCCSSSIPRGIAMIPSLSAGLVNQKPTLLLFNAGTYTINYGLQEITFEVKTEFPRNGNLTIEMLNVPSAEFIFQLYVPQWAPNLSAAIDDIILEGKPGSFLEIKRTWENGGQIKVEMPIPIIKIPDGNKIDPKIALKRGPQILAEDENISDALGIPEFGWVGEGEYVIESNVSGRFSKLFLTPFAEAGQTMANYNLLFSDFTIISERKIKSLQEYRNQLNKLRKEFPVRELPKIDFFQFGMGNRKKIIYREGKLFDPFNGDVLYQWQLKAETIIPNEYKVSLETITDNPVLIYENESGVYIKEGGKTIQLEGTSSPLQLPDFGDHPYSEVLKVLHHEILINIMGSKPLPNYLVYNNPWRRDAAIMAMCLNKTNNLNLIRDWAMEITEPYDKNNAGETEPDNLGQTLYLVSLFANKNHPVVEKVLKEVKNYEVTKEGEVYIEGRSDFHNTPVYQTKWLKFGLQALGLKDTYTIPSVQDDYSSLFWWDYKDQYLEETKDAYQAYTDKNKLFYPYIGWAADHFHQANKGFMGDRDYPLTWEQEASQAYYPGLRYLGEDYAKLKLSAPHTWHAAEMFLYLLDLR